MEMLNMIATKKRYKFKKVEREREEEEKKRVKKLS